MGVLDVEYWFYVCFMPQYALGFMGMTRRIYTYDFDMGWGPLNVISTVGAFFMGIGFIFQAWQILHGIKYGERDVTGDPWNGRTLEWSIPSPPPHYNFAVIPTVTGQDAWWTIKEERKREKRRKERLFLQFICLRIQVFHLSCRFSGSLLVLA